MITSVNPNQPAIMLMLPTHKNSKFGYDILWNDMVYYCFTHIPNPGAGGLLEFCALIFIKFLRKQEENPWEITIRKQLVWWLPSFTRWDTWRPDVPERKVLKIDSSLQMLLFLGCQAWVVQEAIYADLRWSLAPALIVLCDRHDWPWLSDGFSMIFPP